jgi:hypothetical protein
MKVQKVPAQSLVEFALIAPVLLLLAVAVWDGGGVLREQLILQESARAGARLLATGFGTVTADQVTTAVRAAGADLPLTASDPISVDAGGGTVTVSHTHELYTPVLRRLWGGGTGTLALQAQAKFYVPVQGPARLATPAPSVVCTFDMDMPAMENNSGWFSPPFQPAGRANAGYFVGRILANWTIPPDGSIWIALYAGNPFAGAHNPLAGKPDQFSGLLFSDKVGPHTTSISIDLPTITPGSTYTLYFYNFGNRLAGRSVGTASFLASACP